MNDRLSGSASRQEAAQKIRATLVELLRVAKLGGLDEAAHHLAKAIAETDRAIAGEVGPASHSYERRDS